MMKPSVICGERWDVVVVPFPFTERPGGKRRPALVLSKRGFNRRGHTVLAMITSASHHTWPGDCALTELGAAGLRVASMVRPKLFTLDNRLLIRKVGRLAERDCQAVEVSLRAHLW